MQRFLYLHFLPQTSPLPAFLSGLERFSVLLWVEVRRLRGLGQYAVRGLGVALG